MNQTLENTLRCVAAWQPAAIGVLWAELPVLHSFWHLPFHGILQTHKTHVDWMGKLPGTPEDPAEGQ